MLLVSVLEHSIGVMTLTGKNYYYYTTTTTSSSSSSSGGGGGGSSSRIGKDRVVSLWSLMTCRSL